MLLIAFFAMVMHSRSFGQNKPSINLDTYKSWSTVTRGGISNNGKYAFFLITNKPIGNNTFVIKTVDKKWEIKLLNVVNPIFTKDSKYLIGQLPNDTLFKLDLITKHIDKISNVKSYDLVLKGKSEEIVYSKGITKDLILSTQKGKESVLISDVENYTISPDRTFAIVEQSVPSGTKYISKLSRIEFESGNIKIIYSGSKPSKIEFDHSGNQIAFMAKMSNHYSLWYFKRNLLSSKIIANESNNGIPPKLELSDYNYNFSKDGESIFFYLKNSEIRNAQEDSDELVISSYKDNYLQGETKVNYGIKTYLSILNIKSKKVIQLLNEDEEISDDSFKHKTDSLFVIDYHKGNYDELYLPGSKVSHYLVYSRTGKRRVIEENQSTNLQCITISNTGKYIVYYDQQKKNYINYIVSTGDKINLTRNVGDNIYRYDTHDYSQPEVFPVGIVGWLDNDEGILIRNSYDILCIDPLLRRSPIDLTLGIGNRNKIVFNVIKHLINNKLSWNSEVVVSNFNTFTKDFGYSKIRISKAPKLEVLSSRATYVCPLEDAYAPLDSNILIKSKDVDTYLVLRQSSKNAPNFYFTNNLKEFIPLSDNQPQKNYNWLYSELHNYNDNQGRSYQGILYKPENFDSTIKYPLLFMYYDKFSNTLNAFPTVELPGANFSISIAVSNGYLVFLPDIIGDFGKPGEGALRSVVSAIDHLGKYSWADTSKIGVAGHSYGGFETNYIITHLNSVKAAISGAGFSDLISTVYDLWGKNGPSSKQDYFLNRTPKMKASLADSPDIYIENSPLLLGKKITTPLLLMHNQQDGAVPYNQSRQLFMLLRSLQKPVWWLNYRNENHAIGNEKSQLDYNIKVFQFLDHYLKGKPEPKWMIDHS